VLAECCVFIKQSRLPFHCNLSGLQQQVPSPTRGAPYPEVTVPICRVPSPEFSQAPENSHLAHVCPFTVRSSYNWSLEAFPGSLVSVTSCPRALVITPWLSPTDLPIGHAYTLKPGHPTPGSHNLLRPPIASYEGIGLLTDFPSATRFRLTLGADSPCADERCAGNLGLSASRLFTCFIATHVSIRTSDTSSRGFPPPSQAYGTLSYRFRSQRSGNRDQTLTSRDCCAIPIASWRSIRTRRANAATSLRLCIPNPNSSEPIRASHLPIRCSSE
jgi:hypothetical protein